MKKPTLTIGIPAYNEENNIARLLNMLCRQNETQYKLEKIVVVNDGSSDTTASIVRKQSRKYSVVSLIDHKDRKGKTTRLNEIYASNTSSFLLTLDADIIPSDTTLLDRMFKEIAKTPKNKVYALDIIPLKSAKTITARLLYQNSLLWNSIRRQINNGNSIYNMYGSASLISRDFAKLVVYPEDITCDEGYLFVLAHQQNVFKFLPTIYFYNRPVSTLHDYFLLGSRSLKERDNLVKYFGPDCLSLYHIPFRLKLSQTIRYLLKNPLTSLGIIGLNIVIRLKNDNDSLRSEGMWEQVTSTKEPFGKEHSPKAMHKLINNYSLKTLILMQSKRLFGDKSETQSFAFPKKLKDYKFVEPLYEDRTHRPYSFGLYKNASGEAMITKFWHRSKHDFHYYSLINEICVYMFLSKIKTSSLKTETYTVSVPRLLYYKAGENVVCLGLELLPFNQLTSINNKEKAAIYGQCIAYLLSLPKTPHDLVISRSLLALSCVMPIISLQALAKNPKNIKLITSSLWNYFAALPELVTNKDVAFIHRSLEDHNMLVSGKEIALIDFQLSVVSHPLLEICQTLLYAWENKAFCELLLHEKPVAALFDKPQTKKLYKALAIYTAIQHLALGDLEHHVVLDYLDSFCSHQQKIRVAQLKGAL